MIARVATIGESQKPDCHDYEQRHLRAGRTTAFRVCYDAVLVITGGLRPKKTRMDSHEKDLMYQKGLEAFNSAHFYDAHEHWEEVWLETPNPDKMFLQGLIQVAAAFHHYSRANLQGTRNLLQAGLLKLNCFPEVHGGVGIWALSPGGRGRV